MAKFKVEVDTFRALVCQTQINGKVEFWLQNKEKLPNLFELFEKLVHIPAASSFIEGFFSIAGYVSGPKGTTMGEDLLIARALIRANDFVLDLF